MARGCFLRGWHNIWPVNLGDICYLHYIVSQMYTCGFLDKIDCYWGFFLRLYISLDRFILFVIRSHCAPSSGGRRCRWCSFKWFTRKAVFVLNRGSKMQKWKKVQSQGVLWQVTKYTFACNICRLKSWSLLAKYRHHSFTLGSFVMYISPAWEGYLWVK